MKKLVVLFSIMLISMTISAQKERVFEKSAEVGYALGVGDIRSSVFNAAFNYDFRLSKLATVGAGTGIGITDGEYEKYLIPLYARFKLNFTEKKISPYFLMNVGYTFSPGTKMGEGYGVSYAAYFGSDFNIFKGYGLYFQTGFLYQKHDVFNDLDYNEYLNKFLRGWDIRIGFRF
jgi:hypothetical protein